MRPQLLSPRGSERRSFIRALYQSMGWIAAALLFNLFVYLGWGQESALQFFTAYLIEKMLSVDNLALFVVTFLHFQIRKEEQKRVLLWGLCGAVVFRFVLITAGLSLVREFHWVFYFFGLLLLWSGVQLMRQSDHGARTPSFLLTFLRRWLPITRKAPRGSFFMKEKGRWKVTGLFIVLLVIEGTDVLFAIDSIPAVFAITTDPFIVYTSNLFAVFGLRSLYFVIAASLEKLRHLKKGLSVLLLFIGLKMVFSDWIVLSISQSLLIVALILGVTVLASIKTEK